MLLNTMNCIQNFTRSRVFLRETNLKNMYMFSHKTVVVGKLKYTAFH